MERGFSVNKDLIPDNLSEESLIGQRLVHQAIPTDGNKFFDVMIDKQMINDARMAWRGWEASLEEKSREKKSRIARRWKKKRKRDAIQELILEQAVKNIDVRLQGLRK